MTAQIKGRPGGFTLIEMIMVIVIASVLGVGIVQFIVHSMQGVIDTAGRQQMALTGALLAERLSRELREALPNSIRVYDASGSTDNCIEWVPVVGAANYFNEVGIGAVNNWDVMVPDANETVAGYVSVYPIMVDLIYPNGTNQAVSQGTVIFTAGDLTTVDLGGQQFPADSPSRRYFVVSQPESLCFSSGYLYRYTEYGFDAAAGTNLASGTRQTVTGGVSGGRFNYVPSSLVRNAVVSFQIDMLSETGEQFTVNQQVQVRNVP